MWRRMKREAIQVRDVVGVDAIAQLVIRCAAESRHEHAGEGAEPDIDYIVTDAAAAERPACVIAAERPQAALPGGGYRRNREVDARNVRHVDAEQVTARRGRHLQTEDSVQNRGSEHGIADVRGKLLIVGGSAAVPLV